MRRAIKAAGPWATVADAVFAIRPWMNPEVRKGRGGVPWFGVKISATEGRLYRISNDGFYEFTRTSIGTDGDHNVTDPMWTPTGRVDNRPVTDLIPEIMYSSAESLHDQINDDDMPAAIRTWSRAEYDSMVTDGHFDPAWADEFASWGNWADPDGDG